jgi:hypothetical protein
MSNEESIIEPAAGSGVPELAYEDPIEQDGDWLAEQPGEELPRRPRRRLLSPVPLALLGVLMIAGGFIAGVLVEKGRTTSSAATGASGLASRFAALRGKTSGAAGGSESAAGSVGSFSAGGSTGGGFLGRSGGANAAGGATAGQVAYVSGSTLYVTTAEGNTVKVTTSPSSTVSKTVKANVDGIHPGETVVVTGSAGAKGVISAESIRVGTSGGGLGALFGGSSSSSGAGGRSASGGGEPALFGRGG